MPHVFISYVRQDSKPVERLCNSLRENGIRVWIDQDNISPGTRWKQAIRKAIKEGDFFIACFSPNYINRASTYMNEELALAIESLRQKSIERAWLIPVLLSECEVPDLEIRAGETLLDIQQVRLYEDWDFGINQILSVVKPANTIDAKSPSEEEGNVISVLFLAANPSDTARLRTDEELREIQLSILSSELRDRFHFEIRTAVRPQDLGEALLRLRPRFVHFSGHGTSEGELILNDDSGMSRVISMGELASFFKLVSHQVECVVLNVAYSEAVAKAIAKEIKYVIGFNNLVGDADAIIFAASFYRALSFGREIEEAFNLARGELRLRDESGSVPVLIMKE